MTIENKNPDDETINIVKTLVGTIANMVNSNDPEWDIDPSKACDLNDPECEACQ